MLFEFPVQAETVPFQISGLGFPSFDVSVMVPNLVFYSIPGRHVSLIIEQEFQLLVSTNQVASH